MKASDDKLSLHGLKTALLAALDSASPKPLNKFNLIGRPHQRGDVEARLGVEFDSQGRSLAANAFGELRSAGLIEPTFADIVAPEDWVVITDSGRDALAQGLLDDLDQVLRRINPYLLEIRRGARTALEAGHPDSLRQSAHSARELVDQTLKEGAPDDQVRGEPTFKPDPTARSGITRRMRLKYLMTKFRGQVSDTALETAEAAGEAILSVDARLTAFSHGRSPPTKEEVRDSLEMAEIMLRLLLVGVKHSSEH